MRLVFVLQFVLAPFAIISGEAALNAPLIAEHKAAIEKAAEEYRAMIAAADAQLVSSLKQAAQHPGADRIAIYETILMIVPHDESVKAVLLAEQTNEKNAAQATAGTNEPDDPDYPASEGWKKGSDGIWRRVRPSNLVQVYVSKSDDSTTVSRTTARKNGRSPSSASKDWMSGYSPSERRTIEKAIASSEQLVKDIQEREKTDPALRARNEADRRAYNEYMKNRFRTVPTVEDHGRFQPLIDAARNEAIRESRR
jgi:hypothetical protein